MKIHVLFFFLLFAVIGFAQDSTSTYQSKKIAVSDTVVLDSVSINPARFEILNKNGEVIDSTAYSVDFKKGVVVLSEKLKATEDSLTIKYLRFPNFLTKEYFALDEKIIVEGNGSNDKLISLQESNNKQIFTKK